MVFLIEVEKKTIPNYMKYVFGGLAGMMGSCIVQPLDLVKTRMQIAGASGSKEYTSSFDCIAKIFKNEGFLAFYNGLSAGLMRQATYTTTRMGVYQMEIESYRKQFQKAPTVLASMGMGIFAGAIGAFVGNPAEVALIRMMADNRLPPNERRGYKNVGDAFVRIVKEEGLFALWRGSPPTIARAMVVNMVQLASYSQLKNFFKKYLNEGLMLHISASMMSGLLTTITSMPLDMAKTRIQNMKVVDGKPEYTGTANVLVKVLKNEGVLALWKGFTPYLCRVGPHTVFAFVFLEQLNKAYYKYVLGEENTGAGI
ncbi:mitochondrial 2-oxoglutarate/malate carrier protein-like [Scaptodrosophila lebanonensis]|uniref:Mitochondrial 2-oxoglutarate/malate carrier protein n=1 Tax=Drosophila lebanonensis TaxID=7225 RepID=A0A6J2TA67_DROLE|nr:mitochondrial 2-oxoglutarate/malate carrier protein-like [Scaptodrosophila lebanonensis]